MEVSTKYFAQHSREEKTMRLLHKLALAVVLMSLLAMLFPISVAVADDAVNFPDPNLQAAIRQAIGKPTGDIYQSDLAGLTALNASERGIANLSGLEHCSGLTYLNLFFNQIGDISPLSGLTSLTFLNLWDNQISDISPLSGLISLTWLDLAGNRISDISPLSGLTNLTWLGLDASNTTDLSPLSSLTSLTELSLSSNGISDISPLSGLTSLTTLYLENNHIADISPLSGLTSLTFLMLSQNSIVDISPLSDLTSLDSLYLDLNQVSDISPLSGPTCPTYMQLDRNQISDISPLVNNVGLTQGHWIILISNPLNSDSINVCIPQLQARGVGVMYYLPENGMIQGLVEKTVTAETISGATVVVDGTTLSGTSIGNGWYFINNVPPGSYTVTASANGYISSQQSVTVTAGQTSSLDLSLNPAPTPTPTPAPTPTPTPTPPSGQTLHLSFGPPTFTQNGNWRPVALQAGDEIIQFTRPNLVVGTNPTGIFSPVGQSSNVVTGDLAGTMTLDSNVLTVTWAELPPGTRKGYSINTLKFDDGYGNTFSGVGVGDLDMNSGAPYPSASGYFVSTSGTGTFSGQVLIGTGSADTNGVTTMTLRRYASSEVSGPYAMSTTGTSINGNSRDLGGSTGPDLNDEFLQVSRSNIVIPKGDPAGYIEGGSSSGSITSGIMTGSMTQTYNHIFIPGTTPPYQGLTIAKVTGSNASGTIMGIGIYDYLGASGGSGSSYGYMFAPRENGTGAYAGKDFYATGAITDTAGTWTGNANLYIMEPSTPTPTPTPAPTPTPIPGSTLHLSFGPPTFTQNGNWRPVALQAGDEIIQFSRPNLVVGTNPTGIFSTVGQSSNVVTGDLVGTMTLDSNVLTATWDELPPGTRKGYSINTLKFDDGYGNTFSGVGVGDLDMNSGAPYPSASGYFVSTSGTGTFSGQVLIGTGSADTNGVTTMTLRRYSSTEVSVPQPFSVTGTIPAIGPCSLGPSNGSQPSDEFIQFTRDNISIPAGDPVIYTKSGTSSGSCTGALTGTMTNSPSGGIVITGANLSLQGWQVGKFTYSDGRGTITGINVYNGYGGTAGSGYMFALSETGTTGAYTGKDYFIPNDVTINGQTFSVNANLYTLTPSGQLPTPPTVTTNQATNVFSSSAILRGNLDSLGSASSVDVSFQWATDDYYTMHGDYDNETSPPWPMTTAGTFSYSLTGLSPDTTYHFRAKAVGDGTAYGNDTTFTTAGAGSDGDGVPANIEDNAPNSGDGNYDGIPDSQQADVASIPNAANGGYATIESPSGTSLTNVAAVSDSSLPSQGKPNLVFPQGFFSFDITGVPAGSTVWVTLRFENPLPAGSEYWKYGPTTDNHTPHWYQIPINVSDGGNVIQIPLVDGGLGDDDLTANGVIVDQGGPGNPSGGGAAGVPVFPNIYIGIVAALGAAGVAYVLRKRFIVRR